MKTMLTVLADKYGIDINSQVWEVELFNKLCSNLDFEDRMLKERKESNKEKERLLKEVSRLQKLEAFIISLFSEDKKLPSTFKDRLRKLMKEDDIYLDIVDDKPVLRTVKPASG